MQKTEGFIERKVTTLKFIKGVAEAETAISLASVCLFPLVLGPSALVAGSV